MKKLERVSKFVVSAFPKKKTYAGVVYYLFNHYPYKRTALSNAQSLRRKGYSVRLQIDGKSYAVYTNPKLPDIFLAGWLPKAKRT